MSYSGPMPATLWTGPAGSAAQQVHDYLFIRGSQISWLSNSQIQIAIGQMRDDTDNDDIDVTSTLTVDISTTGANGRNVDTAEQSDKWYAIFTIKNVSSGAIAGFAVNEDDLGAFTYPAGYTLKRRVGWVRNNSSSNIRNFIYHGEQSWRKATWETERVALLAISGGSATSFTNIDISEWVPPTSIHCILNSLFDPSGTSDVFFRPDNSSVIIPVTYQTESTEPSTMIFDMVTSTAQIIEYSVGGALDNLDLYVVGFYDEV